MQIFRLKKNSIQFWVFFKFFLFLLFSKGPKNTQKWAFFGADGLFLFFFINLDVYLVSLHYVWNEKFLALIKKNSLNMQFFEILLLSKKIQKWSKKALKKVKLLQNAPSTALKIFFFLKIQPCKVLKLLARFCANFCKILQV